MPNAANDSAVAANQAAAAMVLAAERQGFDDGWFHNPPKEFVDLTEEAVAYGRGFLVGDRDRALADKNQWKR